MRCACVVSHVFHFQCVIYVSFGIEKMRFRSRLHYALEFPRFLEIHGTNYTRPIVKCFVVSVVNGKLQLRQLSEEGKQCDGQIVNIFSV